MKKAAKKAQEAAKAVQVEDKADKKVAMGCESKSTDPDSTTGGARREEHE